MKACADCGPCLMKRILFQSRLAGTGKEFKAVKQCMGLYSELMRPDVCSAEIATEVHRLCYEILENPDPYHQMKVDADRVAERYLPQLQTFIDAHEDRFRAAVMVSVIGNIMDFGSGNAIDDPEEFDSVFDKLMAEGLGHDEVDDLRKLVDSSETILYAFDNCGESQFDKLLIRELKSMGKRVVGVVRGKAILNDVTLDDAVRIGLDAELDRIVTTGGFAVGFPKEVNDDGFLEELGHSRLMIAKGMANYESLSEFDMHVPVAFLLRTKCLPVASSLGLPHNINIVQIQP